MVDQKYYLPELMFRRRKLNVMEAFIYLREVSFMESFEGLGIIKKASNEIREYVNKALDQGLPVSVHVVPVKEGYLESQSDDTNLEWMMYG